MNAVAEQIDPRTAVSTFLPYASTAELPAVRDLMSVRPGVPAKAALREASCLLSMLFDALLAAGEGEAIAGNQAYLMHHALESAKAIVDAAEMGLEGQQ